MPPIVQFVDRIAAAGATVRLDLNASPWSVQPGVDFSPPPLKRSVADSIMRDGGAVPASAYGLRTIRLPLYVSGSTQDAIAAQLSALTRELDRPSNFLKVQTGTFPVFFRTFRSTDYQLAVEEARGAQVTLSLLAEPFAYGVRVDALDVTVTNDPAAATNPQYADVTGVLGDVPTPALIEDQATTGVRALIIGTRRRGTPSNLVQHRQAEGGTLGTDTTLPGNDSTASGSGSNYARVSFATQAGLAKRLSLTFPGGAGVSSTDYRGVYRVYARVRNTVAGTTHLMQLKHDTTDNVDASIPGDVVTVAPNLQVNTWGWVDLGLVNVPVGFDPVRTFGGVELPARSIRVDVLAQRTAGTGSLDVDYLAFVPADAELGVFDFYSGISARCVVDGPHEAAYMIASGNVRSDNAVLHGGGTEVRVAGGFPLLAPGVTNRLVILLPQDLRVGQTDGAISYTRRLLVSYWPRFLYVRSA